MSSLPTCFRYATVEAARAVVAYRAHVRAHYGRKLLRLRADSDSSFIPIRGLMQDIE